MEKDNPAAQIALECHACLAHGANEHRLCWADDEPKPIEFCGVGPVIVTKGELQELLENDEKAYEATKRISSRGLPVCPVPLSIHEDLATLLQLEADLDAWHAGPLDGGVLDWPADLVAAFRHVRGIKGLLQMKRIQEKPRGTV